ncbi:hypothetical protein [Modestobacter italicus]|uniref:hypothetical protein n=1 Tax=Modestobacter italicus (strain DSM 44449 / CECT 9708 / BC 501) TaxID=2732864 RepID=UPI001C98DC1D|nr:hypothetical protein [Modestobacter italicus]
MTPAPVFLTATCFASTDLAADAPEPRVAEFVAEARRRLDGAEATAFRDDVARRAGRHDVELQAVQAGLGFWPGGAEPSMRFCLVGAPDAVRETAVQVARAHEQDAVRLVWPAPLPGRPAPDLPFTDLAVRYVTAGVPPAPLLRRLVGGVDTPGGSLLGEVLHVDAGGGFLAAAHAELSRWLVFAGWSWCSVESWGPDGRLDPAADAAVPGGWARPSTVPALHPRDGGR